MTKKTADNNTTPETAPDTWLVVAQDSANRQYFRLFTEEKAAMDYAYAMLKKPIIKTVGLFLGDNVQLPTT